MKSDLAKVLHEVAGRPMILRVVERALALRPARVVVVVGHQAKDVEQTVRRGFSDKRLAFATQRQRLGTGHAVLAAKRALSDFSGDVLILSGDVPLVTAPTLRDFVAGHRKSRAHLTAMSFFPDDPRGYGRIVRGPKDELVANVEERDATPGQKKIREANAGIYAVDAGALFDLLRRVGRANDQGEYYLTDIIALAVGRGLVCRAVATPAAWQTLGVNSRADLAAASAKVRAEILDAHMRAGVTIVDPAATYVDEDVTIGVNTVLHPQVTLSEGARVGSGCVIGQGCVVNGGSVGDGARLDPYVVLHDVPVLAGGHVPSFTVIDGKAARGARKRRGDIA